MTPRHVGCTISIVPALSPQLGLPYLTSFNDFGLAEPIIRALAEEQYATPTPIQTDAIPLVLAGRDIVGIAQTGTGKTAAFALPILNRLHANRKPPGEEEPARAGALADARTVRPDPRKLPHLWPPHAHPIRARHRRRADGPPGARPDERPRRAGRDARPPARPAAARMPCASIRSKCWCSTKPTACSTWASSTTSARSSRSCRRSARRCCSPPPCRARSRISRRRCCAIRRASP